MIQENPKISVILSNFNGDKYINLSIDSFLSQNYNNKELIIVDGKSTDESHKIISNYNDKFSNIIWVTDIDSGISEAINNGLQNCSGDIIMQMGHDDILQPKIFKNISYYSKIIDFDSIYFDSYNYFVKEHRCVLRRCPDIKINRMNLLKYGSIVGGQCIYFKRHVFDKYKFNIDNKYSMDYEFLLNISNEGYLFLHIPLIGTISFCDSNISTTVGPLSLEGIQVAVKFSNNVFDILNVYSRYYSIKNSFIIIMYLTTFPFKLLFSLYNKKLSIEYIIIKRVFDRL